MNLHPKSPAFNAYDPSCWIAPDGTITFLGGAYHTEIAETLLRDSSGGTNLERKGYLHVSGSSVYSGWHDGRRIDPTQPQLDSLFDIAQASEEAGERYHPQRYRDFIAQHPVKETL